jgi:hypothetical protein
MTELAMAAIPSIFKALVGGGQMIRGMIGQKKLVRPEYKMPDEAKNAFGLAAANYADRANGADANYQRRANEMATANALNAATQRGGGLSSVAALAAGAANANARLGGQVDTAMQQRLGGLIDQSGKIAQYRDQEFQMNKYAPFVEKYNEFREMKGAGQQNFFGAMDSLSSLAMYDAMSKNGDGGVDMGAMSRSASSDIGSVQAQNAQTSVWGNARNMRDTFLNYYNSGKGQAAPAAGLPENSIFNNQAFLKTIFDSRFKPQ